jgi:hypothetical protein
MTSVLKKTGTVPDDGLKSIKLKYANTLDFKKPRKLNLEIQIPDDPNVEVENHELMLENLELKKIIQQMMNEGSKIENKMFILNDQIQTLMAIMNKEG